MKRIIRSISFVIVFAVATFAQDVIPSPKWERAEMSREEFTCEFPATPESNLSGQDGGDRSRSYLLSFGKSYFFVLSERNSDGLPSPVVELFSSNNPDQLKFENKKIGRMEFAFMDDEGFYHRVLEIRGKSRTYLFYTVNEVAESAESKRFFNSIEPRNSNDNPVDPIVVPQNSNPKITKDVADVSKAAVLGTGRGTNPSKMTDETAPKSIQRSGEGSGSGVGTGAGRPVPSQNSAESGRNSGVKILVKRRPYYTDLARLFGIAGTIRLRLTLRADGSIGEIVPVTRLPFGLTKSAIDAARDVRFEPAYRKGVAVTVIKLFEFTFTLY